METLLESMLIVGFCIMLLGVCSLTSNASPPALAVAIYCKPSCDTGCLSRSADKCLGLTGCKVDGICVGCNCEPDLAGIVGDCACIKET